MVSIPCLVRGAFVELSTLVGEVRTLFAQEQQPAFSMYLDKFFGSHRYPSVSWIYDVGKGRLDMAANALLEEADGAGELSAKHVSYSPLSSFCNYGRLTGLHTADVKYGKTWLSCPSV